MRFLCLSVLSTLLALVLCATAAGQDFCVAKPRCIGTAITAAQLKGQLVAAQSNGTADRFFLGQTTFADGPYAYSSSEPVEIVGTRGGGSILRSAVVDRTILTLGGSAASSVSDVHLDIAVSGSFALDLAGGTARGITVTQQAGTQVGAGVLVTNGATLAASSVVLSAGSSPAAGTNAGEATIVDSTLASPVGGATVGGTGAHLTLIRDTLVGAVGAMALNGSVTISDTLIDGHGGASTTVGLLSFAQSSAVASIHAERVTIVGYDGPGPSSVGAYSVGDSSGTSTVDVHDSVMAGIGVPFLRNADATSLANVSASYVARGDFVGTPVDNGPGSLAETQRLPAPVGFVDAAGGDFHLRADSSLVDAGDPVIPAGAATTDRDGALRLDDGDGDCVARHDVGAYEYQRLVPRAVAAATSGTAAPGATVGFSSAGSCDPEPGDELSFAWHFDDGAVASGPQVEHAFATAGHHTATLTVVDAAGHAADAAASVDVTAAASPPQPDPGGTPRSERTKPVLAGLRVPRRVTLGTALPRLGASRRVPTIAFRLSERARVRLRFARRVRGGRFRAIDTSLSVAARPGANRLRFTGRLTRRVRLAPGRYRVTLTATDAAGNRSRAVTDVFRIV